MRTARIGCAIQDRQECLSYPGARYIVPLQRTQNMKNKKINAVQVWKEREDREVPRLHLSVIDRVVYSYLLSHSRLEGRPELRFSILWLARGACLSTASVRKAVRSLVAKGAMRLAERSRPGHVANVRLPEEIRSARGRDGSAGRQSPVGPGACAPGGLARVAALPANPAPP